MQVIRAQYNIPIIERDIFLLLGQSNMSGRGLLSEVPSFSNVSLIKVYSNAGVWVGGYEPTDDPTGQIDTVSLDSNAGASPGMSFANSLINLRPGREVGLVQGAKGGSSRSQWVRNLSRGSLYGSMLARAQEARQHGTIRGAIVYQGENDADTMTNVNAWVPGWQTIISNLRSDLELPNLPFIITALGPDPGDPAFPYHNELRNAQLAMTGSNLAVVSAADLTGKVGDAIHLNTASQITLGQRYATQMNSML